MPIGARIGMRIGARIGQAIGISADPIGGAGGDLILKIGDSNAVGIGVVDGADTGFGLATPNPLIPYLHHTSGGVGPPPVFVDFPAANTLGPLGPYAPTSGQSMSTELTLGPVLRAAGMNLALLTVAVSGSTLATEWLPTSTYPAAGAGNLYHLMVAQVRTIEAQTGRKTRAIEVHLGTNDALGSTNANAFAANMPAINTQLRIDFPGAVIVWVKTNVNTGNSFTSTVRTAQTTVAAGDPLMTLIDIDDDSLIGDLLHYTTSGYMVLGQRVAYAMLDLLGIARQVVRVVPAVVSYGPEAHGSASPISVFSGGGEKDGDLQILQVPAGIVAGSVTTPSGWTLLGTATSTASGVTEEMAFYSRAVTAAAITANNGHMPPASVAFTTVGRVAAKIYTVRGPNLNPTVDVFQTAGPNTFDTGPTAFTGVTTTAANELIMLLSGGYCGSSGTMSATSALAGFAKIQDTATVIVTDRELLSLWTGTQATIGGTGNPSVSSSANMVKLGAVIGIKP